MYGRCLVRSSTGLEFLQGGGVTGDLVRSVDWSATPIGPPSTWPRELKTTLGILFHTRQPMFLWWGPELVQFYNDAYMPSFGVGKHPLAMGQRGPECWPEIWPIIGPQIRDVMEQGKPSWNENQLVPIFRNGRIEDVWWTYGYSPVYLDDGRVGGTLVVCLETTTEVTNRAAVDRAHAEAEQARARFRALFENAPFFVATLRGPEHVFELANGNYQRLVGARRELLGRPCAVALPEVVAQGFITILDGVYRSGTPYFGKHISARLDRRGDGALDDVVLEFVYQPRLDADGAVEGIDVFGFEVTEQARTQAELRKRVEFERYLLGIVSHDLRNPLNSIALGAGLLMQQFGNDPVVAPVAKRMQSAAMRGGRMVGDLLDLTQARLGGGIPIALAEQDMRTLAEAVVEEMRTAHRDRTITFEHAGDPRGSWDGDRVTQVIGNLVSNAIHHGAATSHVTLRIADEGENVAVVVHNLGRPIPVELIPHLFNPMERGVPRGDTTTRSVGLGLYIVREIVHGHGGTVSVVSTEDTGTTFTVRLPKTPAR